MERWYEDGNMDRKYAVQTIKAGVLQTIASQFVGQTLQERLGMSEMSDGINQAVAARKDSESIGTQSLPRRPSRAVRNGSATRSETLTPVLINVLPVKDVRTRRFLVKA
jgi:hypothetical protein